MRFLEMSQGIHDSRASIAVADEDDIGARIDPTEGVEVSLELPGTVEEQVAGAAVPGVVGTQLLAFAGQGGHLLVGFAEVQQYLFAETAHKDDGHIGLSGGQRLLAAATDDSLCRCRVYTDGDFYLLLLAGWQQQKKREKQAAVKVVHGGALQQTEIQLGGFGVFQDGRYV